MSSRILKWAVGIFGALVFACATGVLSAVPASASGLGTTCLGTATSEYVPGLTNDTATIHASVEQHFFPCLGGPISGGSTASGTSDTSCSDLTNPLEQVPTGGTISWSNGQNSSYSGQATREKVNADIVAVTRGQVTAGLFAGYHFLSQTTYPNVDLLACSDPEGIEELKGVVLLVISPLPIP